MFGLWLPAGLDALVLVVDVGRRIEGALEAMGAIQRARPVEPIGVADRVRDLDLALGADLLADERHREQRRQVVRADRLVGARVERRRRRDGQVGRDVVPGPRDPRLIEDELRLARIRGRHGDLLGRCPGVGSGPAPDRVASLARATAAAQPDGPLGDAARRRWAAAR